MFSGLRNCSGHGTCVNFEPQGSWQLKGPKSSFRKCNCELGYSGEACEILGMEAISSHDVSDLFIVWAPPPRFCSGHGLLKSSGVCECLTNWELEDCSYGPVLPCPHNCSVTHPNITTVSSLFRGRERVDSTSVVASKAFRAKIVRPWSDCVHIIAVDGVYVRLLTVRQSAYARAMVSLAHPAITAILCLKTCVHEIVRAGVGV